MIDTLVDRLRANACVVHGPMPTAEARALVTERVHGLVACNADLPFTIDGAMTPDDPAWHERLPTADFGVTGARLAVADPAAIALAAAPGAPRATSLVPPAHICLLRTDDVVPTLADALARVATAEMPSALTWIGGPSRTGDLEMILTLGVHGPRTVEVVLLTD
jgi:L-lactate dehydrogenase complex protein LldG